MLLTEPMLEVTRNRLRSQLTNVPQPRHSIRITNEERVPAEAGEEFINLFGAISTNEYAPSFSTRKELYSFKIGITRRFSGVPLNHSAEGIYTYDEVMISRAKASMARRAHEIITILDGSWYIPNSIRLLTDLKDIPFCILTPLGFESSDPLIEVMAEHFCTEDEEEGQPVGLFLTLNFSGLETYYDKY